MWILLENECIPKKLLQLHQRDESIDVFQIINDPPWCKLDKMIP